MYALLVPLNGSNEVIIYFMNRESNDVYILNGLVYGANKHNLLRLLSNKQTKIKNYD